MFQIKKIFTVVAVLSLTACSSPPDRGGDSDPYVIMDTAPGMDEFEGENSGVEVLPFNSGSQSGEYGSEQDMNGDPMKNFQEVEMFEPVIYFELNQYELTEQNTKVVKHFSQEMLNNDRLTVKIKGHTDERGTPEYNLALGERRAKSVAEAMMLFGIDASRIDVISYGEEDPVDTASNEAAWQKNRRAELVIR